MTGAASSGCYRFGKFELQPEERRLLAAGTALRIGPHAFDLLLVLVERSGRLVTKDQLLELVWPGLVVEENTLQVHVSALRKILGADAIATISGRGYRFALEVTHVSATPATPDAIPGHNLPRHNLPHQQSSFIGRERQIAELERLLGTTRLLTLTGAGGCGKTRLAMQVAGGQVQAYPDGVWLVEFAHLANPDLVPKAVATVLGVKEQSARTLTQALVEHVEPRRLLLVLDNAEHVLGACAQLVDTLLRGCGQLAILVTSRERLGIAGELTYRVPSLSIPEAKPEAGKGVDPERAVAYESVRLFVDRARLQRPHFAVTAENASALAAICQRLDGIPLAIELAAARMRSMPVEEINRRLDQRFSLLTAGSPAALPRQRRLRSLIDWSYDLLRDTEKVLLNRVSVFAGGWTLEAAERVCAFEAIDTPEILDLLMSLADKSLLAADERDGVTRYGLLETVRHYARDQLRDSGEETLVQRRHLHGFHALAEEFKVSLRAKPDELQAWLGRLETEHDNLRAALAWSTTSAADAATGLDLATKIAWFWAIRGHFSEGRAWLTTLLAIAPGEQDPATRALALVGAGVIASQQGDNDVGQSLYEESLELFRRLGDRSGIAYALRSLGNVALARGDFAAARALKEESLVILRELGLRDAVGELLGVLGEIAGEQGDYLAAGTHLDECLSIAREIGDRQTLAWTHARLGRVKHDQGDYLAARAQYKEALTLIREFGNQWAVAAFLEGIASVAARLAGPAQAACVWGGAERLREQIGAPMPDGDRGRYSSAVAAARAAMSDERAFDHAWQDGRAMTPAQAVQFALDTEDHTSVLIERR